MNYFFNPFGVSEDGPHRRSHQHHHHHPYGVDGFNGHRFGFGGHFPPSQPFGPDARLRRHEWGPFRHEGRRIPPWFFESYGGRGSGFGPHRGGRGGFGFHGHEGFGRHGFFGPRGWDFQLPKEDYSSSSSEEEEEKNPKMPEEIILSDNSGSEVECLGEAKLPQKGRCQRRCGRKEDCRRPRRFGKSRGGPDGFHGCRRRRFGRRGRCPWISESEETGEKIIPVEDASASDFQIIQDDVTAEISNLQLQPDEQQNKSNKKCFKVALNVDGFKAKDIRIRRNSNTLLIEGKQNAGTELGTFQRSFAYKITIPAGIDPKKIKIKLSPDGILRIKAKKSRQDANEEVEEEILLQE